MQLEEKRKEVASLRSRLAQLAGRVEGVRDNLPRPDAIFVGRAEEKVRCLQALLPDDRGWGVVIDGIGGMGKTAAGGAGGRARGKAAAMFDGYAFASAKTSWLSPDGVREETLALSSLDAFARTFALAGLDEIARMPDADARREARQGRYAANARCSSGTTWETLVAEERDRITAFLRRLPAPNKAIVTSRRRTGESALTVRLDRLSFDEAKRLAAEVGQRQPRVAQEIQHVGEATLRKLDQAAGGNPLALHWTLGFVAQKGLTLPQALARLENAAHSKDLHAFLFNDAVHDLSESDNRVLVAMTTFRNPAPLPALIDATRLPHTSVEMALEALVTLSLASDLSEGHYALHPLTRNFVLIALQPNSTLQLASPLPTLDCAAQRTALRYWVEYTKKYINGGDGGETHKNYHHLDAAWPELEAAADTLYKLSGLPDSPLRDERAAQLLVGMRTMLRRYLHFRDLWTEQIQISIWAYQAARVGEWRKAGWAAYYVAWTHYERAETDHATVWAEHTAEAMQHGGSTSQRADATRSTPPSNGPTWRPR